MTALAFDLFAGARGWEADAEGLDLRTIGFEVDPDACATARAAGLHTVQDDLARLVPAVVALVYGQPAGIIASPPCQLFSGAGKGTGRQLMEELHRAITDAAAGASDVVMARHRRELKRLLFIYLRETEGYKRARSSRHRNARGKAYVAESTPIRPGELRAEADRMARNVSLVWQPARWVAALRPRWVALEQVPAVLPLWEAMARALKVHGYRCWTGVLSAERYGVPQTRKRAILLASLDGQPQPPEATHQAYVPGEPAREGEPDLFGPGLKPWVSMAEALGWGMTERPTHTVTSGGTASGGGVETFGGGDVRRIIERERERGAWLNCVAPDEIEVEVNRGGGMLDRYGECRPRKGNEPSPTIRCGTGGGCGPNLTVKLVNGTHAHGNVDPDSGRNRGTEEPAPAITSRADQLERRERPTHYDSRQQRDMRTGDAKFARRRSVDEPAPTIAGESRNDAWTNERPATTVAGDPRVFPPGHKVNADDLAAGRGGQRRSGNGHTDGTNGSTAVRVSVQEAAVLQSFPTDWPWQGVQTSIFQQVGNAIPPRLARAVLQAVMR